MKKKATIGIAQYPITFHDSWEQWEMHITAWVADGVQRGAQLLVFPEYASMELVCLMDKEEQADLLRQVRHMHTFQPAFLKVFEGLARSYNVIIVAPSFPVMEDGKIYNRTWVFSATGLAGHQDKWMMTRFENEDWKIDAGQPTLAVFEAEWGKFGIQTCYDVEFAIGSALLCSNGADLILAPSCTETIRGATRVHVGARARALENQCYVAVSQVIGNAPWSLAVDINYGYTAVYSTPDAGLPEEGILAIDKPQQAGWLIQELDFELIQQVRANGAVLNFRDHEAVTYGLHGQKIEIRHIPAK